MTTPEERFWSKVDRTGDCWLWTAGTFADGYGQFRLGRRKVRAHRFAFETVIGPVADGLHLDHLCRVRRCVRPDHLEPVTVQTNILRGVGLAAMNAVKTCCDRGHPFDEANTYNRPTGGRACRTCRHEAFLRYRARRRATSSTTQSTT